jgi:hypothetical protein
VFECGTQPGDLLVLGGELGQGCGLEGGQVGVCLLVLADPLLERVDPGFRRLIWVSLGSGCSPSRCSA